MDISGLGCTVQTLKNTYTTFYMVMASYLETHKIMNPKPLEGCLKIIK